MRILHISTEKAWGGGEQQIAYLLEELRDKADVELYVACRSGSAFETNCREKMQTYRSFSFRNTLDVRSILKLRKYCIEHSIDIIHAHSGKGHSFAVLASLLGAKAKLVVSRRVAFELKDDFFTRWKFNYSGVKKIVCVSDKVKEITGKKVADKRKLVTVYSGIDTDKFRPFLGSNFLRKHYPASGSRFLVGNIGSLLKIKDQATFVRAAEVLLDKGLPIHFFIIGEGPEKASLEELIYRKKLNEHITMTGFLTNIPEALPSLDLFVMSSLNEGLGTSILDAFAAHVPVAATRVGAIPELVAHGRTGLLSEAGNAEELAGNIERLYLDSSLCKHVREGALEKLSHFNYKETARRTIELYREVMAD
ncbi:MAG: glycosyltransferase family 4 protein [Cytophagales bacterium]|nr:glycosyltransferase family 4 protein [Cytophagales bacterium]